MTAMFSKRHYEALAAVMRETKPPDHTQGHFTESEAGYDDGRETQWLADVEGIASVFMADNPKFDSMKFLKACGC